MQTVEVAALSGGLGVDSFGGVFGYEPYAVATKWPT